MALDFARIIQDESQRALAALEADADGTVLLVRRLAGEPTSWPTSVAGT